MSKLEETRTDLTLSTRASDPWFRADEVEIGRKPDGWKALTFLFPSVMNLATEDLNISRYGDFELTTRIVMQTVKPKTNPKT